MRGRLAASLGATVLAFAVCVTAASPIPSGFIELNAFAAVRARLIAVVGAARAAARGCHVTALADGVQRVALPFALGAGAQQLAQIERVRLNHAKRNTQQ